VKLQPQKSELWKDNQVDFHRAPRGHIFMERSAIIIPVTPASHRYLPSINIYNHANPLGLKDNRIQVQTTIESYPGVTKGSQKLIVTGKRVLLRPQNMIFNGEFTN